METGTPRISKNTDSDDMARQRRRRPPSCGLCRTRKLRCNRANPCSNCTIRGIQCDTGPRVACQDPVADTSVYAESSATNLVERIAHLEAVLADSASKPSSTFEVLSQGDLAIPSFMSSRFENVTSDVLRLEGLCTPRDTLVSRQSGQPCAISSNTHCR